VTLRVIAELVVEREDFRTGEYQGAQRPGDEAGARAWRCICATVVLCDEQVFGRLAGLGEGEETAVGRPLPIDIFRLTLAADRRPLLLSLPKALCCASPSRISAVSRKLVKIIKLMIQ
jgi:hypothetical protein